MSRSEVTIDLGALRRNVETLRRVLGETKLWAVVKANAYGHGAADVAGAALDAGATAVCVVTVAEGLSLRHVLPEARIVVLGPTTEIREARDARLELCVSGSPIPEEVPVHVKLDTGMGRFGFKELPPLTTNVVGLMTHLATADSDPTFAAEQLARFGAIADAHPGLETHAANSAAALRLPAARLSAARCGVAIYGLSPFGTDPADDGLEPVMRWESELAQVKELDEGESTGYGRRFVAERPTWIGLVPVGYGDGFRRDMSGTEVLVAGSRRRAVGTVSMDSFAVELGERLEPGERVVLLGEGLLAEEHARVAGTINYEITCGVETAPERARRVVVDG